MQLISLANAANPDLDQHISLKSLLSSCKRLFEWAYLLSYLRPVASNLLNSYMTDLVRRDIRKRMLRVFISSDLVLIPVRRTDMALGASIDLGSMVRSQRTKQDSIHGGRIILLGSDGFGLFTNPWPLAKAYLKGRHLLP